MTLRIPFIDKFPVKVIVLEKRGDRGAIVVKMDSARYITRNGMSYYDLKSGNKTRPMSYANYMMTSRGKPIAFLYEYNRGKYVQVNADELEVLSNDRGEPENAKLKIIDEDMAVWGQLARRESEERHRKDSWWQKNQQMILMASTMVFMIILAYLFMESIKQSSLTVIDAFKAIAQKPPG